MQDPRSKYERSKDRWYHIFVPIEIGFLVKAEAEIRGVSVNVIMQEHARVYREAMAQRIAKLELLSRQDVMLDAIYPTLWEVLGGEDCIHCGESDEGEPKVIPLKEYVELVQAEYERQKENHIISRKIAKREAIKKAIATRGQPRADRPAVAGRSTVETGVRGV